MKTFEEGERVVITDFEPHVGKTGVVKKVKQKTVLVNIDGVAGDYNFMFYPEELSSLDE